MELVTDCGYIGFIRGKQIIQPRKTMTHDTSTNQPQTVNQPNETMKQETTIEQVLEVVLQLGLGVTQSQESMAKISDAVAQLGIAVANQSVSLDKVKEDIYEIKQFNARQEQFNARQEQFNARQEQFNANTTETLEAIKENVIEIRGHVIGNFDGIKPDTKKTIERTVIEVMDNPESMETLDRYATGDVTRQERREKVGISTPLAELNPNICKNHRSACGIWVSGQVTEIFKQRFEVRYPPVLKPLIEQLVLFWSLERDGHGRMY